jgi:hypothetical protein
VQGKAVPEPRLGDDEGTGARGVPAFSFFLSCTAAGGMERGPQELRREMERAMQ